MGTVLAVLTGSDQTDIFKLFAEAIAVADAVREAQGRGPVNSFRARDFWEILKDLIDSVLEK